MSAAVSPPSAAPAKTDPVTGFAIMSQPIALTATSPLLASGAPLTAKNTATGAYTIDPATAKTGFVYGALVYKVIAGAVSIFDGAGNWIDEASFDPSDPLLKPVKFAFDPSSNEWNTKFVLSTLQGAGAQGFTTDPVAGAPKYGFIGVFATPGSAPATAVRSALGTSFGIAASDNSAKVKVGLLKGNAPTQDAQNADGFSIVVTDASQRPVADLILSSDTGLPETVALHFYSGGVARAAVAVEPATGHLHLLSATQVTIDSPIVVVNGTLQAQNISYVPYGGSGRTFL